VGKAPATLAVADRSDVVDAVRSGSEDLVLVDAEGLGHPDAAGVVHEGLPVAPDAGHGTRPPHPELPRHLGDCVAVLADSPTDLRGRGG
jgi:hypothetical protein